MTHRDEVIAYLRHLADTPDGVRHRSWLFDAALMLDRHRSTVFVDCRVNGLDSRGNLQATQSWQPIATAPKDGRYVIISDGVSLCDVGMWRNREPEITSKGAVVRYERPKGWFNVGRCRVLSPTHWLPLPPAPGGAA